MGKKLKYNNNCSEEKEKIEDEGPPEVKTEEE